MNIALIGYRGTGKTVAAKSLAPRLGWDWIDADVEIVAQGTSIEIDGVTFEILPASPQMTEARTRRTTTRWSSG